jgi:cbb3-type cytochrome oxidase subunit 1
LLRLLASFGSGCGVFYAKFLRASVGFFLVSQLLSAFVSVRSIDTVARYTLFDVGASRLVTQGFGVFCVLGAIGLISCKVLRGYSEFSFLKNLSFLACTYGVGAGVLLLAVAGFLAGGDINAVDVPFAQVVDSYGFFSTGLVCCAALHFVGLCLFGLDLVVGFVRSRF